MKYKHIVVLMIFSFSSLFARNINVDTDYSCFSHDTTGSRFEFYYSLPENHIVYDLIDGILHGEVLFNLKFYRNSEVVYTTEWIIEHQIAANGKKVPADLLSQKNIIIKPGNYRIELQVKDLKDTTNICKRKLQVTVPDFSLSVPGISSIVIAKSIIANSSSIDAKNLNFEKNTLYVIPNPTKEISGEDPALTSYVEVYNTDQLSDGEYSLKYALLDETNNEVYSTYKKSIEKSKIFLDTITLPLHFLSSGAYKYKISIVDAEKNSELYSTEKKVYIINPKQPPKKVVLFTENQLMAASEFATLDEDQAIIEYKKIRRILPTIEQEQFENLTTLEAKRRFLFRYWKNQDPDTTTIVNEKRKEFLELVDFANRNFSFSNTEGWETDRGRVLLKYGKPKNRKYEPISGGDRSYEKWDYDGKYGNFNFYFVDLTGSGYFILVHSTAPGELRNENWMTDYVNKSGSLGK